MLRIWVPFAGTPVPVTSSLGFFVREHLFNIAEAFQISGQGLVFASDRKIRQIPQLVKVGQVLEFVPENGASFETRVTAIQHMEPFTPNRPLGFRVESFVTKELAPIGTQVWVVFDGET